MLKPIMCLWMSLQSLAETELVIQKALAITEV